MRGRVEWISGSDMNSVLHTRWNSLMQELCQGQGALVFTVAEPCGTRLSADHANSGVSPLKA